MNVAWVNDGRWVALCPHECGGAEMRWPDGKRYKEVTDMLTGEVTRRAYGITDDGTLYCGHCGQISSVVFPQDRSDIELELARRPVIDNRNWLSSESLADLKAENLLHGVGI